MSKRKNPKIKIGDFVEPKNLKHWDAGRYEVTHVSDCGRNLKIEYVYGEIRTDTTDFQLATLPTEG